MKILVTGAAGFIGSQLAIALVKLGHEVVGLDCINDYYDVALKYGRLSAAGIKADSVVDGQKITSQTTPNYHFIKLDLENYSELVHLFKQEKFDAVCNLAAQAGVRYSLENPHAYVRSNVTGFLNILEACRHSNVANLSYASSSSVYGLNEKLPFAEVDAVDHPISLYASTKRANELMAHTYSHLYGIRTTGLRFFTVYGPWGRPDMALFIFVKAALEGRPIDVYNNGEMWRDFTFIDDIVDGIVRVIESPALSDESWSALDPRTDTSSAPFKIYNIGNQTEVRLEDFIDAIEVKLQTKIDRNYLPMQPGDVPRTRSESGELIRKLNYSPTTKVQEGVNKFIDWYMSYYEI